MRMSPLTTIEAASHCCRISTLIAALFASISLNTAVSDDYVVRTWETDQGLPENSATSMIQDSDGFLWFGTYNGLVRFDGIGFKIFDRSNLPELPSPSIVNLYLDQEQRLWVSTEEGLIIREGKTWTRFNEEKGWKGNYIRDFAESPISSNGSMYVATFDGHILEFLGDHFQELPPPPGQKSEGLFAYVDQNNLLWVLDTEFFGSWSDGEWTEAKPSSFFSNIDDDYAMAPSRDGKAWVLDNDFLWLFSGNEASEKISLPEKCQSTWSLYEDSAGNIWIASNNTGLFFYDRTEGEWGHYTTDNLLTHNSLRFVFQDSENHRWVGSSGGGLMQFQEPRFSSYGVEQNLTEPLIKSVSADPNGTIYAATFGGGIQALANNRFQSIETDINGRITVQSVLVDSHQRIWAGTLGGGLLHRKTNSTPLALVEEVSPSNIRSSFQDSLGAVWIGAQNQVYRVIDDSWNTMTLPSAVKASITSFAQKPGSLETYIGSSTSGLFRSDGTNLYRESFDERFDKEGISSLLFLNENELLIGTFDLGLLVWSGDRVIHLNRDRDFPGSGISSVTKNGDELWIGTNHGIVRMTEDHLKKMIKDDQIPFLGQVFTQSDGLSSIECPIGFQPTATIDHNGMIWFASGKGLNSIDPDRLALNTVEPSIVFDRVVYTDETGESQDMLRNTQNETFLLPPNHSNLIIQFTSPSFASPEKIEFEVSLQGPRQHIVTRQSSREIHFHRLQRGDYRLSIKPRNSDGVWASTPHEIQFAVAPFYWQTNGFRAGVGAATIFLTGTLGFWISRRQMGRELKFVKSERRLKNLLEETQRSALIGGWEYDTDTEQLYWTQEAFSIHGVQSKTIELDLDRFYQFYRSNDQIRLQAAITSALKTGEEFDLEVQTHDKNIWLRLTGKIVDFPSRRIYGCFQNIQQQKDRERFERDQEIQARQSQKLEAIGTLAGGIAHDFNNILTGIRGYTDLLALDLKDDSNSIEHVKELQDAAKRATDLVKQILTYSRPGSEKLIPLDLLNVCDHALKLIRASIPSSIEINTSLPNDIPPIAGSGSQIHQLLVNLFTNAAQSIGNLGTISCSLSTADVTNPESHPLGELSEGSYAVFEIADSGKGIEAEALDRIFDPFYTTKKDTGGTGLGLSVVLGIVKSHHGAIRLHSGENKGTTFRIFFPCSIDPVELTSQAHSPLKSGEGQRIMLIDDDQDVLDITSKMVNRLGYSFDCFLSSTDAVKVFQAATVPYALVITDLTMPIMRGDAVIEQIRKSNTVTPVILISGNLEEKSPERLDPVGKTMCLQKPFQYKDLAEAISKAIELCGEASPENPPTSPLPNAPSRVISRPSGVEI